ncbi:Uncharacterised protein [Staphylococcus aureus]|nr:hypothetical protein ERS140159_01724 [Staphylococcus schweitzeri]SUK78421.1 Uncharacterised protein [Staphylococcus aureus]
MIRSNDVFKKRIFLFIILILLLFILWLFDNPYDRIYKSETLQYILDVFIKQYTQILSFAIQNLLSFSIIVIIYYIIKPMSVKRNKIKKFLLSFAPVTIILNSCIYIIILSADDNKIANVISMTGSLFALFYTTLKLISYFITRD